MNLKTMNVKALLLIFAVSLSIVGFCTGSLAQQRSGPYASIGAKVMQPSYGVILSAGVELRGSQYATEDFEASYAEKAFFTTDTATPRLRHAFRPEPGYKFEKPKRPVPDES